MTANKKSPTWWREYAIVTRSGGICADFAFPHSTAAFVCRIGDPNISTVRVRVSRVGTRLRAFALVDGRWRRCARGLSYFETYEAARGFLLSAARAEVKDAKSALAFATEALSECLKIPRRAPKGGAR